MKLQVLDSKGRVTLPRPVRAQLGLEPGDPVELEVDRGRSSVRILPVQVTRRARK